MGLFDHIQIHMTEDEARECLKSGVIYTPYVPLQVTRLEVPVKVLNPGEIMNEAVANGPKCPKCGGSTVPALDPKTFTTERKCLECEVELVQPEGKPPYLKPRT